MYHSYVRACWQRAYVSLKRLPITLYTYKYIFLCVSALVAKKFSAKFINAHFFFGADLYLWQHALVKQIKVTHN